MKGRAICIVFISLTMFILCSCAPLQSTQASPAIYRLQTPKESTGCSGQVTDFPVVSMLKPELPAGLDTDQIAVYLQGGRRLDYAADARWAANLDEMIQAFMISYLQRNCRSLIVQEPRFDVPPAYRLLVKIYNFQPVYDGAAQGTPDLRVSAAFTLIRLPAGQVVVDFTLSENRLAQENNLTAITAGLEDLLRKIMDDAQVHLESGLNARKEL